MKAAERKPYKKSNNKKVTSLRDEATGETLWFTSDTTEGYQLVESSKDIEKLVWMPLTLRLDSGMVECTCLCLVEVPAKTEANSFAKPS